MIPTLNIADKIYGDTPDSIDTLTNLESAAKSAITLEQLLVSKTDDQYVLQ